MSRNKKHPMASRFQEMASHLEKALGLGGEKTQSFIEQLSKNLAPLLDNFEKTILVSKALPLEMMRKMFMAYLREVAKDAGISFSDLKKAGEGMGDLMGEWIRPELLWESLLKVGQSYWIRKDGGSEVDEFGMDPSVVEGIRPFFQFLYHDYWRVEVKGIENIPAKGRCLLVANHSGMLPYDGTMITVASLNEHPANRRVRVLTEDFVFHFPFLGTLLNRAGAVRACPENANWLLKKEELVLVFPEGVKGLGKLYGERYQLKRFGRGGFIKIAIKNNAPIIPVAVVGAEEIHPIIWKSSILAKAMGVPYLPVTPTFPWLGPVGLMPLPTKWSIEFGRPIPFENYKPLDAEDGLLVQGLAEKVQGKIQKMLDRGLRKRKSVWLG